MWKIKINSKQLPIKAHYFFWMAAMGPILPFVTVYGKQLGVSPMIMGTVTAVLPILIFIAKPCFGFVVDYFRNWRKSLLLGVLTVTSLSFIMMYFLPILPRSPIPENTIVNVTISCSELFTCNSRNISKPEECYGERSVARCRWHCDDGNNFSATVIFEDRKEKNFSIYSLCLVDSVEKLIGCDVNHVERTCGLLCESMNEDRCLYGSLTFWGFVILMSLGYINTYVLLSLSDAVCFDVLGTGGEMGFGRQRVWGTIGFGLTAFLAGYTVDLWSQGQPIKTYTPAFILVFVFTCLDLLCCTKLNLPIISSSKSIAKDMYRLLKIKHVAVFLFFVTLAGIIESLIKFFLFWYVEDLAAITGHMEQIKLIEGLIVAAQTFGGEIIFFSLSGKILKKFGYGYSFVFCFICYALRLGLVSLAPNPWWIILIEFFMQGSSYALCYTIIVAFASVVAPPGTSATVQGIVTGLNNSFGFALGSLIGGYLYKKYNGTTTLRIFSIAAVISSMLYLLLHVTYLKHVMPETKSLSKEVKSSNVKWKSPEEATRECCNAIEEA